MTELRAGDLVLSTPTEVARVVVNQHKPNDGTSSPLIKLRHTRGSLTLTPDHVLMLDGKFVAANQARIGMTLSSGAVVEAISHSTGGIINPVTVSGTILVADAGGDPVVAMNGNVQFADFSLSGYAQYTLTYTLGGVFPAHSQAYHDGMLDPVLKFVTPYLAKSMVSLPLSLAYLLLMLGDAANAVGLGIYFLSHVSSSAAALVLIAAIAVAITAPSTVEKV